ncbi:acyltransferase [Pseudomonas sp. 7P_10.2_Bac1]|uniref:acyltransferase family protein n=1 Tax=Pseudomonas sp. 7P_10.2_Bac1 TaxID=2971614 RepID=UPI0021C81FF1|nr:acyltransferase family protein [Pseudomonas sp. 7P_10.2_Bac1]MCU1725728.1 acyltransferase [Pseudomonas sp. 7P_10.2_Bac1]
MLNKNITYRPEIDGLRALAVILVLLYHFELGVPGGFVGVDVFFVISGYLITEVIKNSVSAGRFSFVDFYSRRLLRLHPALIATISLCLIAGYVLMDPASFSELANSATYSLFSASNFYFLFNQGYFDASAKTQPLLHTWSLAAEWQFYIVWPLVVWGTLKISERFLVWLLIAMAIGSLGLSQYMLSYNSPAAYFMMPSRIFELSIGASLVFISRYRVGDVVNSLITLLGLALIFISAFVLDAASPFPGILALIPCFGAAACIYSGHSTSGSVLRIWPMVKLGLVSYSVYLVHWPTAVFYKYYIFRSLNVEEKLILLALSIVLGYVLYVTVERIFMRSKKAIKPLGVSFVAVSVAIVTFICILIVQARGVGSRVPADYLSFAADPVNFHTNNYGGYGFDLDSQLGSENGEKIAVFGGDSFAHQYAVGMDAELKKQGLMLDATFLHGCIFSGEYSNQVNKSPRPACREAYKKAMLKLDGNLLPFIQAQSWDGYLGTITDSTGALVPVDNASEYQALIVKILTATRKDIGDRDFIIIGNQPYPAKLISPATCLLRPNYIAQHCESLLEYVESASATLSINSVLKNFAASNPRTYYVDATEAFCKESKCGMVSSGKILYSDSFHLSIDGSIAASLGIVNFIVSTKNK